MYARRWALMLLFAVGSVVALGQVPASTGLAAQSPSPITGQIAANYAGWRPTPPMAHKRAEPMIVRLKSGRVWVAGAGDSSMSTMPCTASAEIYHPKADRWTPATPLPRRLCGANAIVLRDGRVLVAGGFVKTPTDVHLTRSAWIYRPGPDRWSGTGDLRRSRGYFAMAPLPGGRVLVAGGRATWDGRHSRRHSAEIYHPRTGKWHMTDPLKHGRSAQSSVVLADRDVLVAGGYTRTAERFDVRRQRWTAAGELREWVLMDPSLVVQRGGNVLAIGDGAKVDQYRTKRNVWRPFTPLPHGVHGESVALVDHHPLVMGGLNWRRNTYSARCFGWHPRRNVWLVDTKMPVPKALFGAVRLGGGSVLVTGGEVRHSEGVSYYTRSAARYFPG